MTTTRQGTSKDRTRTASSRVLTEPGPVRVWAEATVTIAVTQDPPQFIKFTTGQERVAANEDKASQVEAELYQDLEDTVERRVKRLARVVRAANT